MVYRAPADLSFLVVYQLYYSESYLVYRTATLLLFIYFYCQYAIRLWFNASRQRLPQYTLRSYSYLLEIGDPTLFFFFYYVFVAFPLVFRTPLTLIKNNLPRAVSKITFSHFSSFFVVKITNSYIVRSINFLSFFFFPPNE